MKTVSSADLVGPRSKGGSLLHPSFASPSLSRSSSQETGDFRWTAAAASDNGRVRGIRFASQVGKRGKRPHCTHPPLPRLHAMHEGSLLDQREENRIRAQLGMIKPTNCMHFQTDKFLRFLFEKQVPDIILAGANRCVQCFRMHL